MIGQMLFPGEGLCAKRALVRSLAGVEVHVVREVLLPREGFRAVRTLERRLACVLSVHIHSD